MSPPLGPKVNRVVQSKPFKKSLETLPLNARHELQKLAREMKVGEYSNSRHLKKRHGRKRNKPKLWQARLDRNYRVTFEFKDGVATMKNVGPHKMFD